jgi:hypothetical protein
MTQALPVPRAPLAAEVVEEKFKNADCKPGALLYGPQRFAEPVAAVNSISARPPFPFVPKTGFRGTSVHY